MALVLSDFDQTGLIPEVLVHITAGGAATLYASPPRGSVGTLVSGDLIMGPDNNGRLAPITRFRNVNGNLSINDNDDLLLSLYFGAGGIGTDLTIHLQTEAGGVASTDTLGAYVNAGGNFVNFNLSSEMDTILSSITDGTDFIFALTRPGDSGNSSPSVTLGAVPVSVTGGTTQALTAVVTDDSDAEADLTFLWTVTGGTFVDASVKDATWNVPTATHTDQDYILTLTVTDTDGASTAANVTITVTGIPNVSPMVTINTVAQTVAGGATINLDATVTDSDGTIASTAWTGAGTFGDASAVDTTWTAPATQATERTYVLRLTATDDDGASTFSEVTMTVPATLVLPVVANQTATVGTAFSLTLPAATGGVAPRTYTATPLPVGVVFAVSTRVLSGVLTAIGTTTVVYEVEDDAGATVSRSFDIVVGAAPLALGAVANQTATVGTAFSLTLPEATGGTTPYTYTATPRPAGFGLNGRVLSGTPTAIGTTTVVYEVTDDAGATVSRSFDIVVSAAAGLPVPANYTLQITHDGIDYEFGVDANTEIRAWRGRLRPQQDFGVSDAGWLTCTVENYEGQWDFLEEGDRIQLLMEHELFVGAPLFLMDGESLPIWSGVLEHPRNLYQKRGRLASFRALGMFSQLIGKIINVDYQLDISSVDAAQLVIDEVGLTLNSIVQSDQSDVVQFRQWWALNQDALEALFRIQSSLRGGWVREGKDFPIQLEHRLHRILDDGPTMRFGDGGDYFIERLREKYRSQSTQVGKAASDGLVTKLTTAAPLDEQVLWAADSVSDTIGFPLEIGAGQTERIYVEYPSEEAPRTHIGVAPDEYDADNNLTAPGWEPIRHAAENVGTPQEVRSDYDTDPVDMALTFAYTRRPGGLDVDIQNSHSAAVSITRLWFRGHPLRQSNSLSVKTPNESKNPERTPEAFYPSPYDVREWHDHIRRIRTGAVRQFDLEWIASDDPVQAVSVDLSDRIYVDYEDVQRRFFIEGMEHIIGRGDIHRIRFLIVTDNGYPFVPGAPILTLEEVVREAVPEAPVLTLTVSAETGALTEPAAPVVTLESVAAAAVALALGAVANQTATVGTAFSLTLPAATGGTSPYTYTATPRPAGIGFSASTRVLSGTPTAAGTTTVVYEVEDDAGTTVSRSFDIVVSAAPVALALGAVSNRTATVGTAYSQTLPAATGGTTPYTYTASPRPAGIGFTPGTRRLSGTPTAAGTTTVVYEVEDDAGATVSRSFNIVVSAALSLPAAPVVTLESVV